MENKQFYGAFEENNPHGVGKGKVFVGKSRLEVTKETYGDRNTNFRKYVKGLMLGMMEHSDYKTLNLQQKTYNITLQLSIVPEQKIIVNENKIQVVK